MDVIEAGFPIASPGDAEGEVNSSADKGTSYMCSARCKEKDIEVAGEALEHAERPLIHVFLATSDIHLQHKLHLTSSILRGSSPEVLKALEPGLDEVEFSAEDATRSDCGISLPNLRCSD